MVTEDMRDGPVVFTHIRTSPLNIKMVVGCLLNTSSDAKKCIFGVTSFIVSWPTVLFWLHKSQRTTLSHSPTKLSPLIKCDARRAFTTLEIILKTGHFTEIFKAIVSQLGDSAFFNCSEQTDKLKKGSTVQKVGPYTYFLYSCVCIVFNLLPTF